ncbi:tRNA (adenine(37)-N6)-methyltransferase isoform X2 [Copidosoma floridanum]|uniref:tRNA (adenine(37)-N6)-methyltransferase isoform X2 n=1 Tax=Copidosoma floridanum TaxID=29053 RepID=UPI0006C9A8A3|nr:tRNA (adenine(37)-N6)-methyltransferase isoform X2 [Copidosoma floridanum]
MCVKKSSLVYTKMDNCKSEKNFDSDSKYLLDQLITARKEINNLRQQIKSLRYVHERDVISIKRLLGLCTSGFVSFSEDSIPSDLSSTIVRNNEPSTSKTDNDEVLTIQPIGTISTWFPSKRGTPRQPVVCGRVPGKLTLFKNVLTNPQHALEGLEEFSHMWILFHFHKNEPGHIRAKVAPPRLNGNRTGVFSTRSPHRPCPIGLSLVKIIKVEDNVIYFEGVDMVDQTPVVDIKPYIPHYDNPMYIEKALQSADEATVHNDNAATLNVSSSLSSSTSLLTNVSRDEQLALRLQAEEFQRNMNFENVYDNQQNSNVLEDDELAEIISNRTNLNPISYETGSLEINDNDEHSLRNSRLLDGADGPSAVCGTDLDVISRRALSLRLDDSSSSSSPIRMGVREAPDGEEGLELPQLNSVQTSDGDSNASIQSTSRQANDSIVEENVRVPDWITRPEVSPLSVVFNERSLQQLREIVNDKADEKRRAVENILKEDPRSVYLRQRYGNQFYTFLIHDLHITCKFDDDRKIVTVFQVRHAGRMCECGQPEWQCSGHSPLRVFNHDQ